MAPKRVIDQEQSVLTQCCAVREVQEVLEVLVRHYSRRELKCCCRNV
jgi:hypothetical protein